MPPSPSSYATIHSNAGATTPDSSYPLQTQTQQQYRRQQPKFEDSNLDSPYSLQSQHPHQQQHQPGGGVRNRSKSPFQATRAPSRAEHGPYPPPNVLSTDEFRSTTPTQTVTATATATAATRATPAQFYHYNKAKGRSESRNGKHADGGDGARLNSATSQANAANPAVPNSALGFGADIGIGFRAAAADGQIGAGIGSASGNRTGEGPSEGPSEVSSRLPGGARTAGASEISLPVSGLPGLPGQPGQPGSGPPRPGQLSSSEISNGGTFTSTTTTSTSTPTSTSTAAAAAGATSTLTLTSPTSTPNTPTPPTTNPNFPGPPGPPTAAVVSAAAISTAANTPLQSAPSYSNLNPNSNSHPNPNPNPNLNPTSASAANQQPQPRILPRSSSLKPPPHRGFVWTLPSPSAVHADRAHTNTRSTNKPPSSGSSSNNSNPQTNSTSTVHVHPRPDDESTPLTLDLLNAPLPRLSTDQPAVDDNPAAETAETTETPVSDGFRNLNRWSASTASTSRSPPLEQTQSPFHRQQNYRHNYSNSSASSHRVSLDSFSFFAPQQQRDHQQKRQQTDSPSPSSFAHSLRLSSARKFAKRRVSSTSSVGNPPAANANASTNVNTNAQRPRRPSSPPPSARPPPRVPPPNLPPIVSLPPLDTDQTTLPSESALHAQRISPTPSVPRSAISSQHSAESNNPSWDGLADRDNTSSPTVTRGTTPVLLPPAPVTRGTMRGHTRNRSSTALGGPESPKDKRSKPSQKAMLSKALAKANTAVQLDKASNYESARESYIEACELLHQVLARTTGGEDRNKLEAIRGTYTSRIDELDGMIPVQVPSDKELPARPESFDYAGTSGTYSSSADELDEPAVIHTATATRINRDDSPVATTASGTNSTSPARNASSLHTSRLGTPPRVSAQRAPPQSSFSPVRRNFEGGNLSIPRTEETSYVPAPLSPRRTVSPAKPTSPDSIVRRGFSLPPDRLGADDSRGHTRDPSHESVSWLDPINESGSSVASSVHSRSSSLGVTRRHIRAASGGTEAEFDAALDAAVEAAYDEGYEPMDSNEMTYDGDDDQDDMMAHARRKVELAKERVRQTERESGIELARERERQRQMSTASGDSQTFGVVYDGNDSDEEEEERMLDELTKDYVMSGDYSFSQQSQQTSNATRESNSSGITSRTWHSSMGSNPPTATTLSTVTELPSPAPMSKNAPPSLPPSQALPKIPPAQPTAGVRTRRLSGRSPGQLKIETSQLGEAPEVATATNQQRTGNYIVQQRQALSATSTRPGPFSMRASSPTSQGPSGIDLDEATSPKSRPTAAVIRQEEEQPPRTESPSLFRPNLHANFSSTSLKSMKQRQLSVSNNQEDSADLSPLTPQPTNTTISRAGTLPAVPPTPLITSFRDKSTPVHGGLYLFESDFHLAVPQSPNSIHQRSSDAAPLPLEPCPADAMLRPFWLMRALYQTLAHPKGGYLTNKLFVPRDAWKVKNVKLRALEDKMAQCDLLTAALLKLARVDSNDADAVLEEMQSFENILEMVQTALSRKLGNEVGSNGLALASEKDSGEHGHASGTPAAVPRSASVSGKSSAFSWRRLRSKGSAVNLSSAYGSKSSSGNGSNSVAEKEANAVAAVGSGSGSIPSLPMVAHPSSRPAKRDVTSVRFDGPYGGYMASLARLFDAAQTVDQIARQVDDPGLRHADKTQVGLELCTRHAAEFFGFYICRFVMLDLSMLMDKFVKRGSEWVLN
ncbi:hypothetical protein SLS62_003107 [Diatrype stigma]|uniref:MIT domain-containing protein n=1 Tax=Diatrype stigma TaxID=117547 RepID=A0AAN9V770_9PEZI